MSSRQVYNLFNFVSDIGGIWGSLSLIGTVYQVMIGSSLASIQKAEGVYKTTQVRPNATKQSNLDWFASLKAYRINYAKKLWIVLCCCMNKGCFKSRD